MPDSARVEVPERSAVDRVGSLNGQIPVPGAGVNFNNRLDLTRFAGHPQKVCEAAVAHCVLRGASPVEIPVGEEPARVAGNQEKRILMVALGQWTEVLGDCFGPFRLRHRRCEARFWRRGGCGLSRRLGGGTVGVKTGPSFPARRGEDWVLFDFQLPAL